MPTLFDRDITAGTTSLELQTGRSLNFELKRELESVYQLLRDITRFPLWETLLYGTEKEAQNHLSDLGTRELDNTVD